MTKRASFNPEDIVGNNFGVHKVVEYVGCVMHRKQKTQQKVHRYKIQCLKCGKVSIVNRAAVLDRVSKQDKCVGCYKSLGLSKPEKKVDNPQDLVGATFRGVKVICYLNASPYWTKSNKRYKYEYQVQCLECDDITIHTRAGLLAMMKRNSGCGCKKCNTKHRRAKMQAHIDRQKQAASQIRAWDERNQQTQKASKTNLSTGIRHYTIVQAKRHNVAQEIIDYRHVVGVTIARKHYKLYDRVLDTPSPHYQPANLASELNNILLQGGKEAFLEWYEKGDWK